MSSLQIEDFRFQISDCRSKSVLQPRDNLQSTISNLKSGRRRCHRRRPPTPPYVRFRIRRFMKSTGDSAVEAAALNRSLQHNGSPAPGQSVLSLPWRLTHPSLLLANSVGYLPGGSRASQLFYPRLLWSSKFESPFRTSRLGLQSDRGPTMPSADFCQLFPSPLDAGSAWQADRSPRVLRSHLHAYARRIYIQSLRTGIGLWIVMPSHPDCMPHMRFLFVGPALCLQLPSDSTSRWTPLLFS